MSSLTFFSILNPITKLGESTPAGYLGEGVLHDGPVRHPPGTLQHQVGVGVPLRGGIF